MKVPPQNLEAEQSVLGSLMIDKDAIFKVVDLLTGNDFYKSSHGKIYDAIISIYSKNDPIDILTVSSKLKEINQLEDVGGSTYLTDLINGVPTSSHVSYYAKKVKDQKILRDLISASSEIAEQAFSQPGDLDTTLDEIEKKIFSISQKTVTQNFTAIKDELHAAYERIEALHRGDGKLRGVPTGFQELDNILSGFQKSDLVVLGARPSLGKTSLMLDMARQAAVHHGKAVGVFSLEMSREQIIERLISAEAQVPLWKLRTGRLSNDTDFELIQRALDTLSKANIYIDDTPAPNILQMRAMARRLQASQGLDIIMVDYLQLIQPRLGGDNTVAQITEVSRGLKNLARELRVPVLALSQLSRGVEQRDVKVPRLSDLRESGSIEQDADVVMFIYRKDRDKMSLSPEEENLAEIIIAKHRNGPLGTVRFKFDAEKSSFKSIDRNHIAPPDGFSI